MGRRIGIQDIRDMALGATVLGAGGGGDPYMGGLMAIEAIKKYGDVELITVDEVPDDAIVAVSELMGAPTVSVEKIPAGFEAGAAYDEMTKELGVAPFATFSVEAGGANSMFPFVLAAMRRIPVVDTDLMGRAFPGMEMTTLGINGVPGTPTVMADAHGNTVTVRTVDDLWFEKIAREVTSAMGGYAILCSYPCTGRQLKEFGVHGTASLCQEIGRAIREAREAHGDPIQAVLDITRGFRLFKGKIVDVERRTDGKFARGKAQLEGLDDDKGSRMVIDFQNENIIAWRDGEPACTVPDLIVVLDSESGTPITTEGLKYGARVVVCGLPCDPQWRTPEGLAVVEPRYFGYNVDYITIEERMGAARR